MPAFIIVETIVAAKCRDDVIGTDTAAEEFVAIVVVVQHFDVADSCTSADCAHGEAVNLVGGADFTTAVTDGHVTKYAGCIVVVFTAVQAAQFFRRNTLDRVLTRGCAGVGTAEKYYTTPQTAADTEGRVERNVTGIIHIVEYRRENDRAVRTTHRINLTTAGYYKSACIRTETRVAFDDCAGFDDQRVAVFNKDEPGQLICGVTAPVCEADDIGITDWLDRLGRRHAVSGTVGARAGGAVVGQIAIGRQSGPAANPQRGGVGVKGAGIIDRCVVHVVDRYRIGATTVKTVCMYIFGMETGRRIGRINPAGPACAGQIGRTRVEQMIGLTGNRGNCGITDLIVAIVKQVLLGTVVTVANSRYGVAVAKSPPQVVTHGESSVLHPLAAGRRILGRVVLHTDTIRAVVGEDTVIIRSARVVADLKTVLTAYRGAATDIRGVGDKRRGPRKTVDRYVTAVVLAAVIAGVLAHDTEPELAAAMPAFIIVETIVAAESRYQMIRAY